MTALLSVFYFVTFLSVVLLLRYSVFRERIHLFSPFSVFLIGYLFYHALPTLYFSFNLNQTVLPIDVNRVWIAVIISFVALCFGLKCGIKKKFIRNKILNIPNSGYFFLLVILLYYSALVILERFLFDDRSSMVGQVIDLLIFGLYFIPILVGAALRNSIKKSSVVASILVCTILGLIVELFVIGSERRTIVILLLSSAISFHFFVRKIQVIGFVVAVSLLIPLIYVLRVEQASRQFYGSSLAELNIEQLKEIHFRMVDYYGGLGPSITASADVFIGTENFSQILATLPPEEFTYGASYYKIFISWIPRTVLPSKPVDPTALVRDTIISSSKAPHQTITFIGEAFWNFGWLGVVIIPFFIGFLTGLFYCGFFGFLIPGYPPLIYLVWVPVAFLNFRGGWNLQLLNFLAVIFQFWVIFSIFKLFKGNSNYFVTRKGIFAR